MNNLLNKPVQYQNGYVEFYKLKFKVDERVLIPRPETELLVDGVLEYIRRSTSPHPFTILDIGTGAGAIIISIAKNIQPKQNVILTGTDVSQQALEVARLNAKLHGVENKIQFVQSDLLSNPLILNTDSSSKIIVTNLPYIPTERINYLDQSVKDFEPHLALDGGEDGFELYRKLFQQIKEKNWTPKMLIGEIDYTHGDLAFEEAKRYFPDAKIEVKKDLAHLQRILTIIL